MNLIRWKGASIGCLARWDQNTSTTFSITPGTTSSSSTSRVGRAPHFWPPWTSSWRVRSSFISLILSASLHHRNLAIPILVLSARSERVPFGDRLPTVGFLRLHVRGVHHHGPRVARPLLPPLARPASYSILDRRSNISRHVGEGHVPGEST